MGKSQKLLLIVVLSIGIFVCSAGCGEPGGNGSEPITSTPTPAATPTPTPTPTLTPTSTPTPTLTPTTTSTATSLYTGIALGSPEDGSQVSYRALVQGTSEGIAGSGAHIYVLVNPVEAGNTWWAQPEATIGSDGAWETSAYFGRDPAQYPEDVGKEFRVIAIVTSDILEEGEYATIPDNLCCSDKPVTVRRR